MRHDKNLNKKTLKVKMRKNLDEIKENL